MRIATAPCTDLREKSFPLCAGFVYPYIEHGKYQENILDANRA